MELDLKTISLLLLGIAVVALLFGSDLLLRSGRFIWKWGRNRAEFGRRITEYLECSAVFLNGLPHFLKHTWSWGPSVPNYAAGGSFPKETAFLSENVPEVCEAVRDAKALYTEHSQTHGQPRQTLEDAVRELEGITTRYWNGVEIYAKRRWKIGWKSKVRAFRKLQLPKTEYERIKQLSVGRE